MRGLGEKENRAERKKRASAGMVVGGREGERERGDRLREKVSGREA